MDKRWYDQWKEYVDTGDQNSSSYPGKIDNAELFEGKSVPMMFTVNLRLNSGCQRCFNSFDVFSADLDSYHLKERLAENEDFVLLPAEAWHKLLSWYDMTDDQPALERKVVLS